MALAVQSRASLIALQADPLRSESASAPGSYTQQLIDQLLPEWGHRLLHADSDDLAPARAKLRRCLSLACGQRNSLFDMALQVGFDLMPPDWTSASEKDDHQAWMTRRIAVRSLAWSIPTAEAVSAVAALGDVIDPLAGTGYWGALVRAAGAQVTCSDRSPLYGNGYHPVGYRFMPMIRADAAQAMQQASTYQMRNGKQPHALLLSWPPPMRQDGHTCVGAQLVHLHAQLGGEHIAYVGEMAGGSCGSDELFEALADRFVCTRQIQLPTWRDAKDSMTIWKRR